MSARIWVRALLITVVLGLAPVVPGANAEPPRLASNILEMRITEGPAAAASCQFLLLADLVTHAEAGETIVPVPMGRTTPATFVTVEGSSRANATCEQPLGAIHLSSGSAAGWEEPGLEGEPGWGVRPLHANGFSPLTNFALVHLAGNGPSAGVACQTLIAFDAIVIAPSIVEAPPLLDGGLQDAANGDEETQANARCVQHIPLLEITVPGA